MSATYWLSIGRNIGAEPMDDERWASFKEETLDVAEHFGTVLCRIDNGTSTASEWCDEETFLVLTTNVRDIPTVRFWLAIIARDYEQDGIGFVGGNGPSYVSASA